MNRACAYILIFAQCLIGNAIAVQQVAAVSKMVGNRRVQLIPNEPEGAVTVIVDGNPVMKLTSSTFFLNGAVNTPPPAPETDKTRPCGDGR